jgi:arabinofuranosyltransferase
MLSSWRGRVTLGVVCAVWVPVLVFAVLAWEHRWMSDDGFINLRIVWNVLHGDGPVFNAGERVEAGTSPLWIGMLVVARIPLFFVDEAWVAVFVGIALSLAGVAFAALGARRWWASMGDDAVLPLGVGLLVALPPMWDFASSGLETGLSFAWLGMCWWSTARRLDLETTAAAVATGYDSYDEPGPPPADRPWWAPVLIGLGPLVRPDFLLFSVAFALAHVAASRWRHNRRANWRALGLGLALPGAYQIFRMGYYGLLVPNTALAKEASRSLWSRGWNYLDIYLSSTLLLFPLLLLLVLFLLMLRRDRVDGTRLFVAAMPLLAGLLHTVYVVKVGGDFMYGRLLLPATFAVLCPFAALPLPRRQPALWVPVGAITAAVLVFGFDRRWNPQEITDHPDTPAVDGDLAIDGVANERLVWRLLSGADHPVTAADYENYVKSGLMQLGTLPRDGEMIDLGGSGRVAPTDRPILVGGSIGLLGYRYLGTHLVDQLALAEPIGAHLVAGPPSRPGHEKIMSWEWVVARFADPTDDEVPEIPLARQALSCGDLRDLVEAVDAPLTPGRFLTNLVGSIDRTSLRIPPSATDAVEEFCPH